MSDEYPLTQHEYAKILGITKEALRSRRRAGKLEGQYILKSNQYFYKRLRPNQHKTMPKNHTRTRRRGVHLNGGKTKYTSTALKQHNEAKMLAKLKYKVDDETLEFLAAGIEEAKKKKEERIRETQRSMTNIRPTKNYGSGIYHTKHAYPQWRPLEDFDKKKVVRSYY
tara:strand:- start:159 stop:662 length:504 start_codon:yes stop_codon:yes gene_type:complete